MDGLSPLLWAALNGYEAVVRLLIERGDVDINGKDNNCQTPRGDIDINAEDMEGGTPLSVATQNGHEAVVRLLNAK